MKKLKTAFKADFWLMVDCILVIFWFCNAVNLVYHVATKKVVDNGLLVWNPVERAYFRNLHDHPGLLALYCALILAVIYCIVKGVITLLNENAELKAEVKRLSPEKTKLRLRLGRIYTENANSVPADVQEMVAQYDRADALVAYFKDVAWRYDNLGITGDIKRYTKRLRKDLRTNLEVVCNYYEPGVTYAKFSEADVRGARMRLMRNRKILVELEKLQATTTRYINMFGHTDYVDYDARVVSALEATLRGVLDEKPVPFDVALERRLDNIEVEDPEEVTQAREKFTDTFKDEE